MSKTDSFRIFWLGACPISKEKVLIDLDVIWENCPLTSRFKYKTLKSAPKRVLVSMMLVKITTCQMWLKLELIE